MGQNNTRENSGNDEGASTVSQDLMANSWTEKMSNKSVLKWDISKDGNSFSETIREVNKKIDY